MIKVFTYGTLKKGYGNHFRLLRDSRFVGNAVTRGRYTMLDAGFPVLLSNPAGFPVMGEVYEVDRETTMRLDRLESVGRMYDRLRKYVQMDSGEVWRVHYYVGCPGSWQPQRHPQYQPTKINGKQVYNWRPIP